MPPEARWFGYPPHKEEARFDLRLAGVLLIAAAGMVSLVVAPMPSAAAVTFVMLGIVGGVLFMVHSEVIALGGVLLLLIGLRRGEQAVQNLDPTAQIPWWQPMMVAFIGIACAVLVSRAVARARRRSKGSSQHTA